MFNLEGSPYSLNSSVEEQILNEIRGLEERVSLLRAERILTHETLKRYYGKKRFEQVAESNAIEGNTLSVGETELAVLKGVTITGHDPAYIRDAIDLDRALQRLVELARTSDPTDLSQIKELHSLVLGERSGAGLFRNVRVIIKGSKHIPPKTWKEIMDGMEHLNQWSIQNAHLPAAVRATVLHAWFVHIHPFIDGNGRTARAITNLELVRAGYPPIIIKKKEKTRYIDALGYSDEGGDLSLFFELIISKLNGALNGLEQAAAEEQGYSIVRERIKKAQERKLNIWNTSVSLLIKIIENELSTTIESVNGSFQIKYFDGSLDLDDYVQLCTGKSVPQTWSFIVNIQIPSLAPIERLAWFGFRSNNMRDRLQSQDNGGPSIFWSVKNKDAYPPWTRDDAKAPKYVEMTTIQGSGDDWFVMDTSHNISRMSTTLLAKEIANSLIEDVSNQ